MIHCVNCGQEVTNETAGTVAPACDTCRTRWREQEITRAVNVLLSSGFTVVSPSGQTLKAVQ